MIYCTIQVVLLPFTNILFTKNVYCAIFKLFEQMIKYMRKGKKGTFKVRGNYNYYKIILTGKKVMERLFQVVYDLVRFINNEG